MLFPKNPPAPLIPFSNDTFSRESLDFSLDFLGGIFGCWPSCIGFWTTKFKNWFKARISFLISMLKITYVVLYNFYYIYVG